VARYCIKAKSFRFETLDDAYAVIDRFRDAFSLVVHDPRSSSRCTSPALAGLEDLLPVKPDVAAKLTASTPT
jgi:hypothetical protein